MEKTTQQKIEIMQAFVDGKTVECEGPSSGGYLPLHPKQNPAWDWTCDYRIKVELLDCWVNVYRFGTMHAHTTEARAREMANATCLAIAVHCKQVQ